MTQILQFLQPYSSYIGGVLSVFVLALPVLPYFKRKYTAGTMAGMVLTIGIFGTFFGVLIGLSAFNLTDEEIGIQNLIDSLKLAFITSVSGMLSNLFIRFSFLFWKWPEDQGAEKEPVDLLITEVIKMTKAVAGDNESSLVTQIIKMRTEFTDSLGSLRKDLVAEQKELRVSFDQFAKSMVENNQKALIEALNGIIKDFNDQLSEQLGGNFKYLNESVGRLNEWQQLYTEKTGIASNKLIEMVDKLDKLSPIIEKTENSISKWGESQNEFGMTVNQVSNGIKRLVDTSSTLAQEIPKVTDELNDITKSIAQAINNHDKNSQKMIVELANKQKQVLDSFNSIIDKMIKEANQQIVDYRNKTDKELEKSIESLGTGMISMSEAFVKKYGNLKQIIIDLDKQLSAINKRG